MREAGLVLWGAYQEAKELLQDGHNKRDRQCCWDIHSIARGSAFI